MKTITRAKVSLGLCLMLFCLGTSHANDNNNLSTHINLSNQTIEENSELVKKNQTESSTQKEENLESFIQNAISGRFKYQTLLKTDEIDNKFTHLSSRNALKNENLFSLDPEPLSDHIKLQKIQQMQKIAEHISDTYNVKLSTVEEIVVSTIIESKKEDISPALVLSLISIESTFKVNASNMGAIGLTQVIPRWHPEKIAKIGTVANLKTVKGSIKVGVEVLKEYLEKANGNIRVALQMYNGSTSDKNNSYSKKVLSKMVKYQKYFEI